MKRLIMALAIVFTFGTFVACTPDAVNDETETATELQGTDHGDSNNSGNPPPPPPPPPNGN